MNNLPEGADLLRIARETLLAEIKPVVPEHARYSLAMIANAMAIAARELEAGERPAIEALARLDAIYAETHRELHGEALMHALKEQERRLVQDIRGGRFDAGAQRAALLAHLEETVNARLAISNPKYLDSRLRGNDGKAR